MKSTRQFLALLLVLVIISCDKDYNTIGEGLVNEVHFNQILDSDSEITTEQYFFGSNNLTDNPVQTNNLSNNLLGFYKHPVYGGSTASAVTQVGLSEYGKDFGLNPMIKKVVLSIPYFSNLIDTDANTGISTYELDSIYGSSPINLKMYRSSYFLNDFDINGETRKYYSDEDNVSLPRIDDELLYENESFFPSDQETTGELVEGEVEGELELERFEPRLRVELDSNDFEWLLVSANETSISSSSNFKDFYRGLYLKAEAIGQEGVLLALDLSSAEIQIFYGDINSDINTVSLEESIKILFSGKKVNMFEGNEFNAPTGVQENIYLNGGQGAMAIVNLFDGLDDDGNGVSDKLDDLRNSEVLINEASLEFYVDQTTLLGEEAEPDQVFLYDIENNKPLLDFEFDNTANKVEHLGKLERDETGYGIKYKLNITEHITDIIRNDSTNVKLGLAITNNVLNVSSSSLKTPIVLGDGEVETILNASILSHRGTVLYNENAVEEAKKLKLKIYYTEESINQ
jgi:hypothetical protein